MQLLVPDCAKTSAVLDALGVLGAQTAAADVLGVAVDVVAAVLARVKTDVLDVEAGVAAGVLGALEHAAAIALEDVAVVAAAGAQAVAEIIVAAVALEIATTRAPARVAKLVAPHVPTHAPHAPTHALVIVAEPLVPPHVLAIVAPDVLEVATVAKGVRGLRARAQVLDAEIIAQARA